MYLLKLNTWGSPRPLISLPTISNQFWSDIDSTSQISLETTRIYVFLVQAPKTSQHTLISSASSLCPVGLDVSEDSEHSSTPELFCSNHFWKLRIYLLPLNSHYLAQCMTCCRYPIWICYISKISWSTTFLPYFFCLNETYHNLNLPSSQRT